MERREAGARNGRNDRHATNDTAENMQRSKPDLKKLILQQSQE